MEQKVAEFSHFFVTVVFFLYLYFNIVSDFHKKVVRTGQRIPKYSSPRFPKCYHFTTLFCFIILFLSLSVYVRVYIDVYIHTYMCIYIHNFFPELFKRVSQT